MKRASGELDQTYPTSLIVYHNGKVVYRPYGKFDVFCPLQLDNYPFDEHSCDFNFGSWTNDKVLKP